MLLLVDCCIRADLASCPCIVIAVGRILLAAMQLGVVGDYQPTKMSRVTGNLNVISTCSTAEYITSTEH